MNDIEPTSTAPAPRAARWVLAGAAVLALGAVGWSLARQGEDPVAETAPATEQAPVSEMIAQLESRLAAKPDDAEGWQMLGWSYFQTGRYAEAATAFKRATTLDPDNAEYWSMLGEALVLASTDGKGLPPDAKAAFDQAIGLDAKDPRARYFQAVALDLDGKHRQAIDAWFDLLADTPADAPYAADIRQVIAEVARVSNIDVSDRLAKTQFAPPAAGFRTDGAAVATGAIPGPSREDLQAARNLPQGQQDAMIQGMVESLAAKLEADPNNADGWIMLMRSRMQLGQEKAAREALAKALHTFRNDGATTRRVKEAAAALGIAGA